MQARNRCLGSLPTQSTGRQATPCESIIFDFDCQLNRNWEALFFLIFMTIFLSDLIRKMLNQLLLDIYVNT